MQKKLNIFTISMWNKIIKHLALITWFVSIKLNTLDTHIHTQWQTPIVSFELTFTSIVFGNHFYKSLLVSIFFSIVIVVVVGAATAVDLYILANKTATHNGKNWVNSPNPTTLLVELFFFFFVFCLRIYLNFPNQYFYMNFFCSVLFGQHTSKNMPALCLLRF